MERGKILVPIITPLNKDQSVNYDSLAKLTKKVLLDGADGIYATGSSAECFLLTTEERKKCLETVIKAADGAFVIAHVGDVGTARTIELAKHAEKVGADVVASVPPFYFSYTFEGVKSYYQDLASSVKIPTLVYNVPARAGMAFSIDQLSQLMKIDGVDYLKFTETNYYMMQQVHDETGKYIFSGADECFLSAVAAGADGGIGSTYNFMVDKYKRIWKLFHEGKLEEALKVQSSANNITRVCIEQGIFGAMKYICSLQGIECGDPRKPMMPLSENSKEIIKKVYEENINV